MSLQKKYFTTICPCCRKFSTFLEEEILTDINNNNYVVCPKNFFTSYGDSYDCNGYIAIPDNVISESSEN